MDPGPPNTPPRSSRAAITTLMAWLSVCLLAAAWGPELSRDSRFAWSMFGLLGLVAALGLEAISRVRQARREQSRQQTEAVVQDRRLVTIARHGRSAEVLRNAIRWLTDLAHRHHRQNEGAGNQRGGDWEFADRRAAERSACWLPVELQPQAESDIYDAPASMLAYVRDISSTGIRLTHDQPVESDEAVLRVQPEDEESMALLVTQCWTRPSKDGWHQSGWKLLAVLSETDDSRMPVLSAQA